MKRNANGVRAFYATGRMAIPDVNVRTTWKTPDRIVPNQVKYQLCKDGPRKCAECRLCAFGRFYIDEIIGKGKTSNKSEMASVGA